MAKKKFRVKRTENARRVVDVAARAETEEGIRQGLEDSTNNRDLPVTEFFAEFEARHVIVMPYPRK